MRVLIAPDGFGGTLSAPEAARAVAAGWASVAPGDDLDLVPLSDGGPGLLDVLATALPDVVAHPVEVEDPLARPVPASVLLHGPTAYVESALACGLHLLRPEERDVRRTTTYGVGQLLAAALDAGARRIVVGLGGSATHDGGAGMLAALGVARLDAAGERLPPGGAALRAAARLAGRPDPRLAGVELVAATDVEARLTEAALFAPQKGAGPDDLPVLAAALERWADLLEPYLGVQVREVPGAGAAGGLGAALLALGARRQSGLELVRDAVRLPERVAHADLVITGEGRFDATSLLGKVPAGVAGAASERAVPCLVLAGQVEVGRQEAAARGIEATYAVADLVGVEESMARPAEHLTALAAQVARSWSR